MAFRLGTWHVMESRECSLDRSYCVNLASCGTSSQARLGTRLNVVVGDLKEVVICEIGANVSKGTVLMTRLDLSLLTGQHRLELQQVYDLIGGAKPYGYGKVRIRVKQVMLEKERGDFASLIERPEQEIDQAEWYQYIDTFIVTMGGETYFDAVHFLQYGQSKQKLEILKYT